jgi:Radial spokehead-like protein
MQRTLLHSITDNDKPITPNGSYRPWSVGKLLKLDYWEHHKPEILKQGRVSHFDGSILNKSSYDDVEDGISDVSSEESSGRDESETANNESKPEIPIPLFASCSGDRLTNDAISPWTIRLSDVVETLVSVQNHVWPGAFAFVKDR